MKENMKRKESTWPLLLLLLGFLLICIQEAVSSTRVFARQMVTEVCWHTARRANDVISATLPPLCETPLNTESGHCNVTETSLDATFDPQSRPLRSGVRFQRQ